MLASTVSVPLLVVWKVSSREMSTPPDSACRRVLWYPPQDAGSACSRLSSTDNVGDAGRTTEKLIACEKPLLLTVVVTIPLGWDASTLSDKVVLTNVFGELKSSARMLTLTLSPLR